MFGSVFDLDDCPVWVVVTYRGRDTELVGQLHKQFDVLPSIQILGELSLHRGVQHNVVKIGFFRVLDFIELIDESVFLV